MSEVPLYAANSPPWGGVPLEIRKERIIKPVDSYKSHANKELSLSGRARR